MVTSNEHTLINKHTRYQQIHAYTQHLGVLTKPPRLTIYLFNSFNISVNM